MPDISDSLRGVVWTAVGAVVMGVLSVAAALGGSSAETVAAFGILGTIFSILSLRQR